MAGRDHPPHTGRAVGVGVARHMIRFTYVLTGSGWAEATLAAESQHITLRISYLSDALYDLTRAVLAILNGTRCARVNWAEEPGEHRLLLTRSGERIAVQVLYFPEMYSDQPDIKGVIRFSASDHTRAFA